MKHGMKLELDKDADAVYVMINPNDVAQTTKVDANRLIDYDANGAVVGIEFLNISHGADLADLPFHDKLVELFDQHHLKQFA